jgi:hypothetical protein
MTSNLNKIRASGVQLKENSHSKNDHLEKYNAELAGHAFLAIADELEDLRASVRKLEYE